MSETFSSFLGYEGCEKERPCERGWASFSDHMTSRLHVQQNRTRDAFSYDSYDL